MRFVLSIGVVLWAALPGQANEALDLLEGQEDPMAGLPVTPQADGPQPIEGSNWDQDYSWRWLTTLPPLWSYVPDDNDVVQEAALTGLFEWRLESGSIEVDGAGIEERDVDSARARRARLGTVLRAFYNTDIEGEAVFDGDADYHGVGKLKATVHVNDDLYLAFGKFRPPFSFEYTRDPSVRLVPEMSPLAAQIAPANSLGVMAGGVLGNWDWGVGWFSNDTSKNIPDIQGDGYVLAKVGYTFQGTPGPDGDAEGEPAGNEDAGSVYQRWHLDYIYNMDEGRSSSIPGGYDHLLATGLQLSSGQFDFAGDFMLANGKDNTVWGMTLQGSQWILEDAVRAVARYSYADTDDAGGLRVGWGVPSPRSDTVHPFQYPFVQTGDELHTFFGGLNFHVFGDYIIVQVGAEYRLLKNPVSGLPDLSSWLWQIGGRAAF